MFQTTNQYICIHGLHYGHEPFTIDRSVHSQLSAVHPSVMRLRIAGWKWMEVSERDLSWDLMVGFAIMIPYLLSHIFFPDLRSHDSETLQ